MSPGSGNFQSAPSNCHSFDVHKIGSVLNDMFSWGRGRRQDLLSLKMGNKGCECGGPENICAVIPPSVLPEPVQPGRSTQVRSQRHRLRPKERLRQD